MDSVQEAIASQSLAAADPERMLYILRSYFVKFQITKNKFQTASTFLSLKLAQRSKDFFNDLESLTLFK